MMKIIANKRKQNYKYKLISMNNSYHEIIIPQSYPLEMSFVKSVLSDKDIQFAIFAKFFILFTCENVVEFFSIRPEVNNPITSLRNRKLKWT